MSEQTANTQSDREDVADLSSNEDQTLLLVPGSKTSDTKNLVKKVARAIRRVYEKHGVVRLRCVGAPAVNNADKALIIASSQIHEESGTQLVSVPEFVTVNFDGSEKTGIVKTVSDIEFFEEVESE